MVAARGSRNGLKAAANPHANYAQRAFPLLGTPTVGPSPEDLKTDFDVVMVEVPADKRVQVMKALRVEFPTWSLTRVRDAVLNAVAHHVLEESHLALAEGVSRFEAELMVKRLRAAGADARLR